MFDRLCKFHAFSDVHAHEYPHLQFLGSVVQTTRDHLLGDDRADEAILAQIEVDALSFHLSDGDLASMYTCTDSDGNPQEYPDAMRFNDEQRSHLVRRAQDAKNPTLVARYSHVRWKAPGRTVERAQRAIDSYLESVDLYIQEDERRPSEQFAPLILRW